MKGPTKATNDLVDVRDGGRCVVCGARSENRHHRQPRRHGDHTPANLLSLCGSGTTGCHGYITTHPNYAYHYGWSVRSTDDPAECPVLVRMDHGINQWVLHDVLGYQIRITDTEAHQRLKDTGLRKDNS